MIQRQTMLRVADNSGAKTVKCISILADKSKYASVGDCIIVSVRSLRSGLTVKMGRGPLKAAPKKGQVYKALIIRTKKNIKHRKNGFSLAFQTNDVVLLSPLSSTGGFGPVGSRIFGPVTRELLARLRAKGAAAGGHKKIISQAKRLV